MQTLSGFDEQPSSVNVVVSSPQKQLLAHLAHSRGLLLFNTPASGTGSAYYMYLCSLLSISLYLNVRCTLSW